MPAVDADSAPYWAAAREHRLVTQRCARCRRMRFPPSPLCPYCRSWDTEWVQLDGTGTVYSWVVVTHPVTAAQASEVPFAVALVEVAPAVRMPSRLVDVDVHKIAAGMPVEAAYLDLTEEITLPVFRPAG